jgi:hypothetical protein
MINIKNMSNCNIFELVGRDVLFPTMTSHTKIHYQPFGSDALASPFLEQK